MTFINTTSTSNAADTYTLLTGNSLFLGSAGGFIATDGLFAGLRLAGGNDVIIDGQVFSQDYRAIIQNFGTAAVSLDIGATGVVRTFSDHGAIQLGGLGVNTLTNRGLVANSGTGEALHLYGQNDVTNFGVIDSADDHGVFFDTIAGNENTLVNHGTIIGGGLGYAIYGEDGKEVVTNHGLMQGHVSLGDGNDYFDSRHGVLNGAIYGGDGNDMIIGSDNGEYIEGGGDGDWLEGLGGADIVRGGTGDDVYFTDGLDDLEEDFGGGHDVVRSTASFQLPTYFEELLLMGSDSINAIGNFGDNELTGNSGNNILDGYGGIDQMFGGAGNDTYITDGGDTISDGLGVDTVLSSANFTLGNFLDNLTLTGNATIDGMGNTGANIIIGNGAGNRLNGGGGADTMRGGLGNDIFITDGGDTIIDDGGNVDSVESSVSYVLGADIENLELTGSAAINGTGNAGSNTIYGNNAANRLDGAGGLNALLGGLGNDTYVTAGTDEIIDTGGVDLVESAGSITLGSGLDNLLMIGAGAVTAVGNALANAITGSLVANTINGGAGNDALRGAGGADRLTGGFGNDTLSGGIGNDVLIGSAGKDVFVFANALNAKTNVDKVLDFNVVADTIHLENAVFKTLTKAGKLGAAAFHKSAAGTAHDASDRIVYETDTGKLFHDANGSAAGGATQFAALGKNLALTAADFFVI